MRLLLVDDERYVLRNIRKVIEESELAFDEVLVACNAEEARAHLDAAAVDVLICDIEMPQESGLDLLVWVADHHADVQSIVLTCHADFNYIRDAMRLNVLDYLVKPVPPSELIAAVRKAKDARAAASELRETINYGRFWRENPSKLQENFWGDVVRGLIPPERESMLAEAASRNIEIDPEQFIIPLLLQLYSKAGAGKLRSASDTRNAIHGIARNRFSLFAPNSVIIDLNDEALLCMLPTRPDSNWVEVAASVLKECEALVNSVETYFSCQLFCYIGEVCPSSQIPNARLALQAYAENDVIKRDRVRYSFDSQSLLGASRVPNLNILAVLLMEGSYGRAKQEVIQLLSNPKADRVYLHQFYQSFLQAFSSVLEHDHLTYEALTGENERLHALSLDSLPALQDGILALIDCLAEAMGQMTVVAEAKRYIDTHLDGKLTRDQLAKQVFLHPDHLNRIFKQEHGMPIHEYIIKRRVELAKELLAKTDLKLSAVAMNVGYGNFAQFSKLFRGKTGMSPKEYRRKHAQA